MGRERSRPEGDACAQSSQGKQIGFWGWSAGRCDVPRAGYWAIRLVDVRRWIKTWGSTRQGQRDKIDDDEHEDDDRSPDGFVELSNQAEPGAEMRVSCAES